MQHGNRLKRAQVLVVASLLAGCGRPGVIRPGAVLAPCPRPYEADIPLPEGFVLVDQSSEDWSSGPARYVRHRYLGRADKYAVRKFYREQMPLVRWTPIDDGNVEGRYTLRFERRNESCIITIADDAGSASQRVIVEAMITPAAP